MNYKWKSKATGAEFYAFDSWSGYTAEPKYLVTLRPVNEEGSNGPSLTYEEFIQAFEKVEE
jgi:hypothetical protein